LRSPNRCSFEHPERAVEILHCLRELGIEIDIDDFGTGYSNLGCLIELPISTLKVDRSFVEMIDEKGGNDEIVRAIVVLARNLGLRVVAEGIETEAQLNKLKSLECEGGQGYLFAPPMSFIELRQFLIAEGKVPSSHPPSTNSRPQRSCTDPSRHRSRLI
jgi:EAL domain-containing protein (putative c-di-GMP-specific phosphodiesterase class I)